MESILKTLDIQYENSLEKAIEIALISKDDKMLLHPNSAISKEEAAQIIYGALKKSENAKPDKYYSRILNYYVSDSALISSTYKAAVFVDIIAGMFEPQVINANKKLFNPKNKLTKAEMTLLLSRLSDKSKRFDPFLRGKTDIENQDMVSWAQNRLKSSSYLSAKEVKLSKEVKTIKIDSKGQFIIDKNIVLNELKNIQYNTYSSSMAPYYLYDDYIKHPWYNGNFSEPTVDVERMKKYTNSSFIAASKFIDSEFNISYKNTKDIESKIRASFPECQDTENYIKEQTNTFTNKKLSVESVFVSDPKMFYSGLNYASSGDYTRGRLYFKYSSPQKTEDFVIYKANDYKIIKIKTNTWYYTDYDIRTSENPLIEENDNALRNPKYYGIWVYQISDLYEIKTKK